MFVSVCRNKHESPGAWETRFSEAGIKGDYELPDMSARNQTLRLWKVSEHS